MFHEQLLKNSLFLCAQLAKLYYRHAHYFEDILIALWSLCGVENIQKQTGTLHVTLLM